jgi:hypothetical protein
MVSALRAMPFQQHVTWLLYAATCVALIALAARREAASRTMVVKRIELNAARAAQASLRRAPLSAGEQARFDAGWIEGRVLLHEARRRGLDRRDPLIRSAILGAVVASLAQEIPEPSPETLRAYYADNRSIYAEPEVLRISLATFPSGARMPPAAEVRTRLERGDPPEAVAPASTVGAHLEQMSKRDLRLLFGAAFAVRVWGERVGAWIGPVDSTLGAHFVRVDERASSRTPPYDEVQGLVRQDWFSDEERRRVAPTVAELRARYAVEGLPR